MRSYLKIENWDIKRTEVLQNNNINEKDMKFENQDKLGTCNHEFSCHGMFVTLMSYFQRNLFLAFFFDQKSQTYRVEF